jgi:alkylation response protein AidB-like acyl-CoA dehydrogenase
MNVASRAFDRPENSDANNSAASAALMTDVTDRILADVQALAPEITRRAAEIEAARRVPLDLVEKMRSIGVFRALAPRSHGGFELDLPEAMKIVETLSRIEGSVGWITMIGMGSAILPPHVRRELYDRIYAKGPDLIFSGSAQPVGKAEATAGGWRVSGRWPFASGCQHADWMFAVCIMSKDGKPLPGPAGNGGPPLVRGVILPAQEWQIEDTWHVAGLKGTGSHHIALKDKVVPEENFVDVEGESCVPGPLYRAFHQLIPIMHIPLALGIAEGALDELRVLADSGVQQQRTTVPMRDSELFQQDLGRVEAELRAARAYADAQTESHWRHALAGTLKNEALLIQGAQAATWITSACVRVTDECFRLGGGSALYEPSPLQRRMRDLHAAAQHAAVHHRIYGGAGKLLLSNSSGFGIRIA